MLTAVAASALALSALALPASAQPQSPGCETARAQFEDARAAEARELKQRENAQGKANEDAKAERDARKELKAAKDAEAEVYAEPNPPAEKPARDKATSDRIAAEAKVREANKASNQSSKRLAKEDAEYKTAQADSRNKGAVADKACEPKPAAPGKDGADGKDGKPGKPAENASGGILPPPGDVNVENNTQNNNYGSPPTAGESVVESDLVVTH